MVILLSIHVGMPIDYQHQRRQNHDRFFCPSGHGQSYVAEFDAERLQKQLSAKNDELAKARARLDQEQAYAAQLRENVARRDRQLSARKGVTTRLKKKVSAGRCPCCSRKFKDLEQHMKQDHPKWDPEKHADALEAKNA